MSVVWGVGATFDAIRHRGADDSNEAETIDNFDAERVTQRFAQLDDGPSSLADGVVTPFVQLATALRRVTPRFTRWSLSHQASRRPANSTRGHYTDVM